MVYRATLLRRVGLRLRFSLWPPREYPRNLLLESRLTTLS